MDSTQPEAAAAATPDIRRPSKASRSTERPATSGLPSEILGEGTDAGMAGAGSGSSSRDAGARDLRVTPQETIAAIYAEFSKNRHGNKGEKVASWMKLQADLAQNAGVLVPSHTSLKDLNATLMDIESMMKGQQGDAGVSPAEYLESWLNQKEIKTQ
jgi:hypothetical protein